MFPKHPPPPNYLYSEFALFIRIRIIPLGLAIRQPDFKRDVGGSWPAEPGCYALLIRFGEGLALKLRNPNFGVVAQLLVAVGLCVRDQKARAIRKPWRLIYHIVVYYGSRAKDPTFSPYPVNPTVGGRRFRVVDAKTRRFITLGWTFPSFSTVYRLPLCLPLSMKSVTDASSSTKTATPTIPSVSTSTTSNAPVGKVTQDSEGSVSEPPHISSSERRLVDPSRNDVVHYTYKGGQTAVMTGGVMLGLGTSSHPPNDVGLFSTRSGPNEGGAKKALSRGKGSYNAGGVGQKFGHTRGSDSADWRKQ
ncbi:hypothetical protein L218DRAFT_1076538 [Marasmius fiardii PR-910]|nr:hypothetical protein L218DRAFT_1076538 [Marasmius fiardii PR-910]